MGNINLERWNLDGKEVLFKKHSEKLETGFFCDWWKRAMLVRNGHGIIWLDLTKTFHCLSVHHPAWDFCLPVLKSCFVCQLVLSEQCKQKIAIKCPHLQCLQLSESWSWSFEKAHNMSTGYFLFPVCGWFGFTRYSSQKINGGKKEASNKQESLFLLQSWSLDFSYRLCPPEEPSIHRAVDKISLLIWLQSY